MYLLFHTSLEGDDVVVRHGIVDSYLHLSTASTPAAKLLFKVIKMLNNHWKSIQIVYISNNRIGEICLCKWNFKRQLLCWLVTSMLVVQLDVISLLAFMDDK